MPVRLRSVLFARLNASLTASCHPFGEDPMIVVTRATAITHLLSRSCGLGGRKGRPRVAVGARIVKDAGRPRRREPVARRPLPILHVWGTCGQRPTSMSAVP